MSSNPAIERPQSGPAAAMMPAHYPGRTIRAARRARVLALARAAWGLTAFLAIPLFIAGVPARYGLLANPSADLKVGLEQLGLSARFYASYHVGLEIAFAAVFLAIAVVIFVRKHQDWVALFLSYMLMLFGMASHPIVHIMETLAATQTAWMPFVRFLTFLTWVSVVFFFCIFPDGKFVPRWISWFALFATLLSIPWNLFPDSPYSPWTWHPVAFILVDLVFWGMCGFAQVYRYKRTSSAMQRHQTKWVVLGATAAIMGNLAFFMPPMLDPSLRQLSIGSSLMYQMVSITAMYLFSLLVPLCIAISILRYRLWDIDLLINRTLVYVPLTGIVAGLYSASVVLFQKVFVALIGETSDAAVVLSTLILASTFTPMKNGLQNLVDKRYKERTAPSQQLDAFGARVLSVIDMSDPHMVARHLLDEAVCAFGAKAGAVYLDVEDTDTPFYTYGNWKEGESKVAVPLQHEGATVGMLKLAAKQDRSQYTDRDIESLKRNADAVARAIEAAEFSLHHHMHPRPSPPAPRVHARPE